MAKRHKNKKIRRLLELRNKISTECFVSNRKFDGIIPKETWFFPEHNGVKGYLGTDKIVFVCLNPSLGSFPSKSVLIFYRALKKYGFQNAHLTDVIKVRLSPKQYYKVKKNKVLFNKLLERHIKWLKKELRIIDKKFNFKIVAIGNEAYYLLKKYFKLNIVGKIYHYAWAGRYKKSRQFENSMRKIAQVINTNIK